MQKSHVTLTSAQEAHLTELTTRGTVAVKAYRRATALLALHAGQSYCAVARQVGVKYSTVSGWAQRFAAEGLAVLADQPRSGRPLQITGDERAKLTALACSKAPDGRSQWSLRLLAGKAVELGYCRQVSAASAHAILKKTRSSPS
ncbi:helix-turn-helix domain-containing protein [Hymenobacter elongatus]|uniref:Helix-turn-helix domain-containing protein n=1 Tax=Hymenobacter elongatus TaxID=877208 RepID=A0A4Z0PER7_9BACT|nr:helix-turn-helix domain-containing protein [Hymenobacter elongatus]TGE12836.1 helix-turn-helix domain-containing protein [Hymenobacter elongatus]